MNWIYFLAILGLTYSLPTELNSSEFEVGQVLDSFNGVPVYYNGDMNNVYGRNIGPDGYNIGLLYQCVEFVKRYYYQIYEHKMPDSYGHAKDFFEFGLEDGGLNEARGLFQFQNGSISMPKVGDILIIDSSVQNPFGHVGIIRDVRDSYIQLIQQNVGKRTRVEYSLQERKGLYYINNFKVLGWLSLYC